MTFCSACSVSDLGTKILVIDDEEQIVCAACESENSVHNLDYEEWVELMEADDADRYNDEDALHDD